MAKKPETVFRESTYPFLKTLPNTFYESISQRNIRGTPDVSAVVNGVPVWLEYKTDNGTVSPLQEIKLSRIRKAGGTAFVVRPHNWGRIKGILTAMSKQLSWKWNTDGSEF